jgi:hypothetical protein
MLIPSTSRFVVHLRSSSPTKPQDAFSATEVRYGENRTVAIVVT